MREKLAWAEAHGVEPPAFVRQAAAAEGWNEPRRRDRDSAAESPKCGCCRSGTCSHAEKHAPAPGCCTPAKPSGVADRSSPPNANAAKDAPVRWVVGVMARQCRGYGSELPGLLPPGVPAAAPLTWTPALDCTGRSLPSDRLVTTRPVCPPTPPPRPV
jgi:hypothetical protein